MSEISIEVRIFANFGDVSTKHKYTIGHAGNYDRRAQSCDYYLQMAMFLKHINT